MIPLPGLLLLLSPGLAAGPSPSGSLAGADPVLQALENELGRTMEALSQQDPAPYFMALEVTDTHALSMTAEEGGLNGHAPRHDREVDVDVRIGSPELDSSHALRSAAGAGRMHRGRDLPLTGDVPVLQREIWREVDRRYHDAETRWAAVEADRQVLVEEDPGADLAPAPVEKALLEQVRLEVDRPQWEQTLREASGVLAHSVIVHDGSVGFEAEATNRWFVSSEGTRLRHPHLEYNVRIQLDTVAEDGSRLELSRSWYGGHPDELPSTEALVEAVTDLESELSALRQAPEQEPYTGPAILSDRAAAVFFHEILGHRLEGHRLKRVDDAQTLRDLVGETILPAFLSICDDPTLERYEGHYLRGHYRFDNQGVAPRRTPLVEDGVLVGFLESRSPVEPGGQSNGHGRRHPGYDAVSRQGNLLVTASRSMTDPELREALRQRAAEADLPYGLYIEEIEGGFTFTGRRIPNAFTVDVVSAWRVYTDGRPDERIRGLDFIGTPLVTLSRIEAAGEVQEVFNGTCGAESGPVPVSAVSPALLISEIETQRKAKAQVPPPYLPPPTPADRAGEGASE